MSTDFGREKQSVACLSSWQISQMSLDILPAEQLSVVKGHLANCEHCTAKLRAQQADIKAATFEPIPEAIRLAEASKSRFAFRSIASGLGIAAAVAVVLMIVVNLPKDAPMPREEMRIKGAVGIEATVLRQGAVVYEDQPIDKLRGQWLPADQLRLRVRGITDRYVAIETTENNRWTTVFVGKLPEGGWVPVGVTLTAQGHTKFRLRVCDDRAMLRNQSERCPSVTYDLGLAL